MKYHIKLTFLWDSEEDMKDAMLTVPKGTGIEKIYLTLQQKHAELDDSDVYGEEGRNPETLLNEVCRENGWTWEETGFDLVAEFD